MRILTDAEVRDVPARVFVAAAREALMAHGSGELSAPPRLRSELEEVTYTYTTGGLRGGPTGFRVYRAGDHPGEQPVAVWGHQGELLGLVVGDELGARRTGALGAVAADALALPDAGDVAVVGSGLQAWTQLWALASVRALRRVRVHSPSRQHREAFADRAVRELGLAPGTVSAVDTAREAVRGADLVVLATRSTTPVVDGADVGPGTHVTTVGPKAAGAQEAPPALLAAAAVLTCDSPDQAGAYAAPFMVDLDRLTPLADVLHGRAAGRRAATDITVHCSVGLAGSEVLVAHRLLGDQDR